MYRDVNRFISETEYNIMDFKNKFSSHICKEDDVEKATFRNMVVITYCITSIVILATVLVQFDASHFEQSPLCFGGVGNVDHFLYIVATACQSIVPTTVTFAGSVLMLQSLSGQATAGKRSLLFVAIIALAIMNVTQSTVKNPIFLLLTSVFAIILSIITLILSKLSFSLELDGTGTGRKSKNEKSDCQPCA